MDGIVVCPHLLMQCLSVLVRFGVIRGKPTVFVCVQATGVFAGVFEQEDWEGLTQLLHASAARVAQSGSRDQPNPSTRNNPTTAPGGLPAEPGPPLLPNHATGDADRNTSFGHNDSPEASTDAHAPHLLVSPARQNAPVGLLHTPSRFGPLRLDNSLSGPAIGPTGRALEPAGIPRELSQEWPSSPSSLESPMEVDEDWDGHVPQTDGAAAHVPPRLQPGVCPTGVFINSNEALHEHQFVHCASRLCRSAVQSRDRARESPKRRLQHIFAPKGHVIPQVDGGPDGDARDREPEGEEAPDVQGKTRRHRLGLQRMSSRDVPGRGTGLRPPSTSVSGIQVSVRCMVPTGHPWDID